MSQGRLDRLERFAKRLVEGSLSNLLGLQGDYNHLASAFDSYVQNEDFGVTGPEEIQIIVGSAELAKAINSDQELLQMLRKHADYLLANRDLTSESSLSVRAIFSAEIEKNTIEFLPVYPEDDVNPTRELTIPSNLRHGHLDRKRNIPVIVDGGGRNIPIEGPVISLGRHLDNDIVVNTENTSRFHAQIVFRQGHWILRDLASRAGTYLNGQRIDEALIQDGDVIKLADKRFIFVQGDNPTQTPAEDAGSADAPTLNFPTVDAE